MDKNIFVTEQFFVEKDVIQNKKKGKNFLRRSKNHFFFFKKGFQKNKFEK